MTFSWRAGRALMGVAILIVSCGPSTGESSAPAAPPAATVAASAAPAQTPVATKVYLSVIGDTVRAGYGLVDSEKWMDCIQANRFPQGSRAVFRFKVFDPVTGKDMDDTAIKSVVLTMGDKTTQEMKYIGRPTKEPTDHFWRYVWTIPADYPTGQLNYRVDAMDLKGRTGTFSEFTVKPSQVVIVAAGAH